MTTEDMTKRAAGVYLRPGSSVWQWALRAPDDLRSVYPTQWAFRCSLKTSDLLQANDKAAVLNAEWRTRFTSQAIESFLGTLPPEELLGDTGEHRMLLDAPYLLALRNLEPA